jgi:hypothetical protein
MSAKKTFVSSEPDKFKFLCLPYLDLNYLYGSFHQQNSKPGLFSLKTDVCVSLVSSFVLTS